MDERARRLLSPDARPRVAVPEAKAHGRREFQLPAAIRGTPPRGERALVPPRQDDTEAWFRAGDDLVEPVTDDDVTMPRPMQARHLALYGGTIVLLGSTIATAMRMLL